MRGSKRTNNAGGGWSIFVDEKATANPASEPEKSKQTHDDEAEKENTTAGIKRHINTLHEPSSREPKRLKTIASGRFGTSASKITDKPLERFDVRITDAFPSLPEQQQNEDEDTTLPDLENWKPEVRLSFQGSSVFYGIRRLVEAGVVDGKRMPGWMTGQEGVSWGIVKDGRMLSRDNE